MIDVISDISVLTDVSENLLKKIVSVCNYSIGHAVHETQCERNNITELDIGIGKLHIKLDEDNIYYRFVPSKELEKILIQTVATGNSPIIAKIDSNLQEKIERTYKELL